ncbi:MAG: diaminopimelate decarboxylase, partial [Armatimonadetes bacterium]|nr:diaminopimelate decarboxylase [Armatimonadota bacterium]
DLLLREAYLGWYHEIISLNHKVKKAEQKISYQIAGPLCFSGDIIARNYLLTEVKAGEYLAILHSGAYVSSMMNNYCGRLNPAQVMLGDGGEIKLIRRRQKKEDLWQYDL